MKAVYAIKCIYTPLCSAVFLICVKRFWPITRVENNSQEKFTILHIPTWDFFVIQTETRFCYMEDGWNICTALWSFFNFSCLSQWEVQSTDNRKVSTFFAFQHVRCRCCYRSYLDHFLNVFLPNGLMWESLLYS